jgi:hypothetical protein
MLESEQSKLVSNEQLLIDLKNTQIEADAYYNLQAGFLALSRLPENEGAASRKYYFEHENYLQSYNDCTKFLIRLEALKKERGL